MNIDALRSQISQMNYTDLEALKKLIAEKEEEDYDLTWWTHDHIDDYLYYVFYEDGSKWCHYLGKTAYEEYVRNDRAVCMKRKTKDLFPTWEDLLERTKA